MAGTTGASFAERMRSARRAGGFSIEEATFGLRALVPQSMWRSTETIRRLEDGRTPEAKADPMLVSALAVLYDVPLVDLSETIVVSMEQLREQVIAQSRCTEPWPAAMTSAAA